MSRKTINSPLAGAAPTLTPAARPIAIPIGATPPPKFSGLMELANAFRDFAPELRDMLRDTAAREDADAMALGELEAAKTSTSQNMAKIETVLKEKVDTGELPRVRFPAFQRGFRLRVGKDLAQTALQNDLTSGLEAAIKGGPEAAEKIASEAYAKHAEKLASSDLYAREGYQSVAAGLLASFRQQAAAGYAQEYQKQAEQAAADEGSELAYQLATADADTLPTVRASMLAQLDEIRAEIPKSETNSFYVERVLAPTVAKLTNERHFSAARQLLDEAEGLDVTGSGGKLGQTAVAKSKFAELRTRIERESRAEASEALERARAETALQTLQGHNEAGAQLQKLRLDSQGALPPAKKFELVDAFRAAHPNEPTLVKGFAEAVQHEYENEEKWRADERATSDLFVKLNTVSKAKLDEAQDMVEALYSTGALAPTARTQARDIISKRRALFGSIDDSDFKAAKAELFRESNVGAGTELLANFGDENANSVFSKLSEGAKDTARSEVTQFFSAQFERAIEQESGGDASRVPLVKATAYEKALTKTREHARSLVGSLAEADAAAALRAKAAREAEIERRAAATVEPRPPAGEVASVPSVSYATVAKFMEPVRDPTPGEATHTQRLQVALEKYQVPRAGSHELALNFQNLPAESDVGLFAESGALRGDIVDLKALAKDATDTAAPKQKQRVARDIYAVVKATLGFTPEEVFAGKTKHGVPFNPQELRYDVHAVFRSMKELNEHYNEGKPTEVFFRLGDLIDPGDKIEARDFYVAQRALLRARGVTK